LPPSDISISAPSSGRKIKLNWKNPPELKGIRIYRSLSSATVFSNLIKEIVPPATFYLDSDGLTDNTTYYYGVRTINYLYYSKVFESANTDVHSTYPQDLLRPETPSNFAVALSTKANSLLLKWDAVTQNEDGSICDDLVGYELCWGTQQSLITNKISLSSTAIKYLHTQLTNGLIYFYEIRAVDVAGLCSDFSSVPPQICQGVLEKQTFVATGSEIETATTFTPNEDGVSDEMKVAVKVNQTVSNVEIAVYSGASQIRVLLSSSTLPGGWESTLVWDGKSQSGDKVSDGSYRISFCVGDDEVDSIDVTVKGALQTPSVCNNYPNPFMMSQVDKTKIRFKLSYPDSVKIAIYNPFGMLVRKWEFSKDEIGQYSVGENWYEVPWRGKNGAGHKVSSGIYICHVRGGGIDEKTKIAIIR